jgi:HSP20 family protein
MALRDLIPWRKRGRDVEVRREEEGDPILSLHHHMGRLFDDAFRGFDLMPFGFDRGLGWPNIEVSETDQEIKVTAEVPGL